MLALSDDLLGVPYKWAGNTPKGFDCSGFTCYLAEKEMGKTLNRRAVDQYKASIKVKRKHVKPGDFVFFLIMDLEFLMLVSFILQIITASK